MHKRTSIILGALIAALALSAAVGTANARRLATSEQSFLAHFRELTFESSGINLVCAVSIEGSFHSRTISKVQNSLIGYISEVRVKRPCSGGEAWALTAQEGRTESLPWHILYERFIGALPNITGIELTLDNAAFLVSLPAVSSECLYQATTASPMRGIINREAGGKATGLRVNEASRIPLNRVLRGIFCPSSGTLKGNAIVGTQVGYREITITLVA
jgi:hypothetical protein